MTALIVGHPLLWPLQTLNSLLHSGKLSRHSVRWDTVVTNQNDELVAQYDVLTMVATKEGPPPEENA